MIITLTCDFQLFGFYVKFHLDTFLARAFHYFSQSLRSIRAANKRSLYTMFQKSKPLDVWW